MPRSALPLLCLALAACSGGEAKDPCEPVRIWADADGDGYGGEELEAACAPAEGQVTIGQDCDDADPDVSPDAEEVCDAVDNDCDGQVDQGLPELVTWYADDDGDGYGVRYPAMVACADPGDGWSDNDEDCDDTDPDVSPLGVEVCNGGRDDDCDGLADDADPSLDPSSQPSWYFDDDGDGYGDETLVIAACVGPAGYVDNGDDCADDNPYRSPDTVEECNERDDDCDGLIDDEDTDTDPATMTEYYEDLDGDGYGSNVVILSCDVGLGAADNSDDCDDSDPLETVATDWYPDNDGDGYGRGASVAFQCESPNPGAAAPSNDDCNDNDPLINPGAAEVCNDFVDHNCDGRANCCDPATEVNHQDRCYYLDGSGGVCETDYELAPQSVLNQIAADFIGKDYKNAISSNCCIWHRDQAVELQDWGMNAQCNGAGPFTQGPVLGGAGCTNALNLNSAQLTLCMSQ